MRNLPAPAALVNEAGQIAPPVGYVVRRPGETTAQLTRLQDGVTLYVCEVRHLERIVREQSWAFVAEAFPPVASAPAAFVLQSSTETVRAHVPAE